MTLSNLTGRADVGTSEFDLKIGVCFVENGSFFENGSLKKKKKREVYIEDSCREVSSCKRNTLIPLQRTTLSKSSRYSSRKS